MDVTALLVVESASSVEPAVDSKSDSLQACWPNQAKALLPLLGRPLLMRIIESLELSGVREFRVISALSPIDSASEALRRMLQERPKQDVTYVQCKPEELWDLASIEVQSVFDRNADVILSARTDAYFELGSAPALNRCAGMSFAQLGSSEGVTDVFWASTRGRADLFRALRNYLTADAAPRVNAITYYNPLRTATDLRRLTGDAFNLRLAFRPAGREIRPGVWAGERTFIDKSARIVAPAFLGSGTKIRSAALVTRGSSIEHHCEVDCGTVVQASNVLPFTYLGAGLELLHSVAGARHVANSAKKRTAEITDPKLLRELPGAPAVRVVESVGKLASFLPKQVLQAFANTVRRQRTPAPDIGRAAIATALPPAAENALAASLAATTVTRDHGNE